MAITIHGTTGISGVDGSAGTPAVQGTDTNTGVFYPAANTVSLATNGTAALTVDASQNVGIGTASPSGKLHVESAGTNYIYTRNGAASGIAGVVFQNTGDTRAWRIDGTNLDAYDLSAGATRLRIDASGNMRLSTAGTKILNSSGNPILQQTGSVLQVLSTTKTDTFSSTSTSFTDITGLSVNITPSSASNKIFIMVTSNYSTNTNGNPIKFNINRDSTAICQPSTSPTFSGTIVPYQTGTNDMQIPWSVSFLDSPATTSATTYKIQGAGGNTWYVNRRASADFNVTSTITVMEIAA